MDLYSPCNGVPQEKVETTHAKWGSTTMSTELFVEVIDHFIKHTICTRDNPTLLIYDNHESHISLRVVDKARSAGLILLTLPPHCSSKMQPLDVAVFASFKAHYNAAVFLWQFTPLHLASVKLTLKPLPLIQDV